MTKRIIYPTQDGVAVLIPAGDLSVEEVARKDVPAGVPYKIIDTADVPSDRTFRAAWEADIAEPDGVGIGAHAWFIEKLESDIEKIGAEEPPRPSEDGEETVADYEAKVAAFERNRDLRINDLLKQIDVLKQEAAA